MCVCVCVCVGVCPPFFFSLHLLFSLCVFSPPFFLVLVMLAYLIIHPFCLIHGEAEDSKHRNKEKTKKQNPRHQQKGDGFTR